MNIEEFIAQNNQPPINTYKDFWDWFKSNNNSLHKQVNNNFTNNNGSTQNSVINSKVGELNMGLEVFAKMYDDKTAWLTFSANLDIRYMVFAEEIISSAPTIPGWKFSAHRTPFGPMNLFNLVIEGFNYNLDNMWFFPNNDSNYPDKIDITIVHEDYNEKNKSKIIDGASAFIDIYIGELNYISLIDKLTYTSKDNNQKNLLPLKKLKPYLTKKQKKLDKKYKGVRYDSTFDGFKSYDAISPNDEPMKVFFNPNVISWDQKASHPWIIEILLRFDGDKHNGLPDEKTIQLFDKIEDDITIKLNETDGYLKIGSITGLNMRAIHFVCIDFRKPSKLLHEIKNQNNSLIDIDFNVIKDKYWENLNYSINP